MSDCQLQIGQQQKIYMMTIIMEAVIICWKWPVMQKENQDNF